MLQQEENDWEQQVIDLTSQMMHWHYCENNMDALVAQLDDDIIWLGAAEQESASGKETVSGIFRQFEGMVPRCILSNESYQAVALAPDVYFCSGRVWIETDPATQISLRVHQRVTLIFRRRAGQLRCCHIHISNPYEGMVEEDVGFPLKMAKQSYLYLQEQIEEQKKQIASQTAQLERMGYEDALTGLYNRHKFNELIDQAPRTKRARLGVACFDLNGLKRVNDQQGHLSGDDLLRRAAAPLRHVFGGRAYRVGGDEFIVVDDVLTETEFYDAVRAVQQGMKENKVRCAVGVSWRGADCNLLAQIDEGDRRMYQDKKEYYRSILIDWRREGGV